MKIQNGFSLVELLVVILILCLLTLFSLPVSKNYLDVVAVNQTKNALKEGFITAKSFSLMNKINGVTNVDSSAFIYYSGANICVHQTTTTALTASADCTGTTVVWAGKLPLNVTIGGVTTNCIAFDKNGLILSGANMTASSGALNCTTSTNYTINKGTVTVTGSLN